MASISATPLPRGAAPAPSPVPPLVPGPSLMLPHSTLLLTPAQPPQVSIFTAAAASCRSLMTRQWIPWWARVGGVILWCSLMEETRGVLTHFHTRFTGGAVRSMMRLSCLIWRKAAVLGGGRACISRGAFARTGVLASSCTATATRRRWALRERAVMGSTICWGWRRFNSRGLRSWRRGDSSILLITNAWIFWMRIQGKILGEFSIFFTYFEKLSFFRSCKKLIPFLEKRCWCISLLCFCFFRLLWSWACAVFSNCKFMICATQW